MNKVYRTVFNETTNTWVAVAEISPAKGKKSRSEKSSGGIGLHLMAPVMVSGMLLSGYAMAAPELKNGTGNNAIIVNSNPATSESAAAGTDSIAIGTNAKVEGAAAVGQSSIAVGSNAKTKAQNNIAIGTGALTENGNTIAVGNAAHAEGQSDLAIGDGAKATLGQGTAVGVNANATQAGASAYGYLTKATGYLSTAIGNQAQSSGISSIAVGKASSAGSHAIAIGDGASATGKSTVAMGLNANASDDAATAIGANSKATNASTAMGDGSQATGLNSTALGWNANAAGRADVYIGKRAGSGTNNVDNFDNVGIGESAVKDAGSATKAVTNVVGIGTGAAEGIQASHNIAIGAYANGTESGNPAVTTDNNIALGQRAYATGGTAGNAIAIGNRSKSEGSAAVAVGALANAQGAQAVAIGQNTVAQGAGSIVLGGSQSAPSAAKATGSQGIAIGQQSASTATKGIAIGVGAQANDVNGVALGSDSETAAAVATTDATINGITYNGFAGTAPTSTVSIGKSGGERTLTNVAAGRITDTSTDAINGSQLYSVVNSLGFDVNADNDAAKTHKLGKELAIVAGNTAEATSTSNLKTEVTQDATTGKTTVTVSMKEAPNFTSVTTTDTAGNKTVTNGSGVTITPASGNPVSLTSDGLNNGGNKITNVAKGTADTDAVNVSQLKGAADALGGGAGVNTDGTFKAPSYTITKTDGTSYTPANNVGEALSNLNAEVIKPITFAGDSGANSTRKLGETLTIKGGATGTLTAGNIGVESDGNGTLTAKLAQNIDLGDNGSVQTGNTKLDKDGLAITNSADSTKNVNLTSGGLNNGGNKITNVAKGTADNDAVNVSQLKDAQAAATSKVIAGDGITVTNTPNTDGSTTYKVAADTTPLTVTNGKVTPPTENDAGKLVTAGDIAKTINNSGFQATAGGNLASGTNATPTTVKPGQKVTFAAGNGLTVKQDIDNASGNQTYTYALDAQSVVQDAQLPVVYTKADGSKVYKQPDGKFYDAPTGGNEVAAGDVIASMQDAAGSTTAPTTLANVKSNLADAGNAVTNPAGNNRADLAGKGNNAATVNDVLNSGFTVQGNGQNKDFVTHGDTINFANGQGTVANVTSTNGVTTVKFDTPMTYADASGNPTSTPSNKVNLVGGTAGSPVTLGNVADGTVAAGSKEAVNGSQLHATNQNVANNAANIAKGINFGGTTGSNNYQLGDTINVKGDSNITSTTVAGGAQLALNPNLNVTSVTTTDAAGNKTVTNGSGVTITPASGNPVSLTTGGLNNGGNKITNVAAGTDGTDAVNVDQLKAAKAAATTKVKAGNGISVNGTQNADGSTTYTVAADTTPLTVANGKVTPPAAADANKLATAGDIANTINKQRDRKSVV